MCPGKFGCARIVRNDDSRSGTAPKVLIGAARGSMSATLVIAARMRLKLFVIEPESDFKKFTVT
jgi:hypothetical protein